MNEPTPIHVTHHAVDRARERFPTVTGIPHPALVRQIRREVGAAIRCGRLACKAPRFCIVNDGPRIRAGGRGHRGHLRYAWTPDEQRAYVIRRQDNAWIVITSVGARPQEQAA